MPDPEMRDDIHKFLKEFVEASEGKPVTELIAQASQIVAKYSEKKEDTE